MAEFVPKNLGEGQLPNTKTTLYTVPDGKTAIIRSIVLVNSNTTTARTVNLYVNFGAGSRRVIPPNSIMAASSKYEDVSALTLEAGDIIEGDADVAANVDYIISGVQSS
jgi:hypothetical protein